jgi:hypothetical protein
MRSGTDRSVWRMRPRISWYSASWNGRVPAMAVSVYRFSASRYAITSGFCRSRSQK